MIFLSYKSTNGTTTITATTVTTVTNTTTTNTTTTTRSTTDFVMSECASAKEKVTSTYHNINTVDFISKLNDKFITHGTSTDITNTASINTIIIRIMHTGIN